MAGAAAAAGLTLDHRVAVELNGEPVVTDGHLPLVRADRVTFLVS